MMTHFRSPSYLLFLFLALVVLASPRLDAQSKTMTALKNESVIQYLLIHPLHEVEAVCKDLFCTIQYDDATQTILGTSFSADVSSFDSGNSNRDSHAMEVLDALSFPTVSFKSNKIDTQGNGLQVAGDLTFHGVTKPITFSAWTSTEGKKLKVEGKANVSLTAFQIERPALLMIPVQDTLRISFTMVFQTP